MNKGKTDKEAKIPVKKDGTPDARYTNPQFCAKDGTRDMRTNLINNKTSKK